MSGDPEAGEGTSSAPGFSWSQVVRKDSKTMQASPEKLRGDEGGAEGPGVELGKVQDKLAAATVGETGAVPPLAPLAQEEAQASTWAAAGEGVAKAAQDGAPAEPEAAREGEEGESVAKGSQSSPQSVPEANDSDSKPVEVKSVWVVGQRQTEGGGVEVESPKAVKVLSTSSQSWPTLGDAKTEPQKRGLPEAASVQANTNHANQGQREGGRGKKGNREYNSHRNSNNAGATGRHGRGGRQNGYKGNQSGNASANQNGGLSSMNSQTRNYRSSRGGQNARGNRGSNSGNQNQQMNGMKGMNRQAPAGYYMPVYYAPMQNAGISGRPVSMMPPPAGIGNPSTQQAGGSVLEAVKVQVEYYFSVQNLVKDMFLRAKMDENGWIPVAVIAAFNRVRALAPDPSMIAAALQDSGLVEVSPDQESIRVRDSWQSWVLPEERRDQPKRPKTPGSPVQLGVSTGVNMASMYPCTEVSDDLLDRLTLIGRLASGDQVKDSKALVMANDVAAMVNNGIAVLESQSRTQGDKPDTLPLVSNHFYPIAPMLAQQQANAKDQLPLVAPSTFGSHIGWMFGGGAAEAGDGSEKGKGAGKEEEAVEHAEITDFGHPAYGYFKMNRYVQIKYKDFRDCCVRKRAEQSKQDGGAAAHTPEMYILYQFWGLFLRDVFNTSMYEDFKKLALEDHEKGQGSLGITCLFGLYHNRLLKEFRPVLFKDFESIVQQEYRKGNHQAMVEFSTFCMSTGLMKGGESPGDVPNDVTS
ncbi:putative RNA-binding protein [Chloropicon primus]|uniref:Putative RNA-binding protein n=1 Tax=Chloropicon primus TaxID=1764295 RepID=A0A5B8MX12_9CHLO|nr:putative RNA-binding protein [Chloropicon primus]UPR03292.1 putative RNA-binding protein [Chloropicon primus]|mmetsp:Transcript_6930/g.20251  ORF Transcript_6930/g.20251 Transcript_6930/m.20251 type:complete len:752 (-) Transcript_6930:1166-3421(-)|eukprot:QDZ24084.1 putative RNA-binding protein [Chloropicon primus]